jgi:hypothetical protein
MMLGLLHGIIHYYHHYYWYNVACRAVPAATAEVLFETVFSTRSVQRCYKEDNCGDQASSVQEAVKERDSWKRAGIPRGLQRRS